MALSEREQQAFEQLEQALHHEDPMFFQRVRVKQIFLHARDRLQLSIVGLVTGLGLMVAFCFTTWVVVGVIGFLVMIISLDNLWAKARQGIGTGADDIARSGPMKSSADANGARSRLLHWFAHLD